MPAITGVDPSGAAPWPSFFGSATGPTVTETGQPLHGMMPNSQLEQYASYPQQGGEIQHADEYKNHALAAVSEALDKAEVDMLLGGRGPQRRTASVLDGLTSGGLRLGNEETAALGMSQQHGNVDFQDGHTNYALQAAREALRVVDEAAPRKTGQPPQGRAPDAADCGLKFDKPLNGRGGPDAVDLGLKFDKPMNARARNRLAEDAGSKRRTPDLQDDTGLKFDKPIPNRRRSRLSAEDADSNLTVRRTTDVQEPGLKFDEPSRGRRRNCQAEDDDLKFDIPGQSHGRAQANGSQWAVCAEKENLQHLGDDEKSVTPPAVLAATDGVAAVADEFANEQQQEDRLCHSVIRITSPEPVVNNTASDSVGEPHCMLHEHAEPQRKESPAITTPVEATGQDSPQYFQNERISNHMEVSEFICDPVKLLEEDDDELEIMAQQEMDADEPVQLVRRLPPRPPPMETPRQAPVAPSHHRQSAPVAPPQHRQSSTGPPAPPDAQTQGKRRGVKKGRGETKERQKLVKRDFLVDSILKDEVPNKSGTPSNARSRSHNVSRGLLLPEMRSRSVPHYDDSRPSKSLTPRQREQAKSLTPRQREQSETVTCPPKVGKANGVPFKPPKQGTSLLPQLDNLSKQERSQRALAASGSQSARTWKGRAAVNLYA